VGSKIYIVPASDEQSHPQGLDKKALARLPPKDVNASRYPTHDELRAAIRIVAAELGVPCKAPDTQKGWNGGFAGLEVHADVQPVGDDVYETYHLPGTGAEEGPLRRFVEELAKIAGPQIVNDNSGYFGPWIITAPGRTKAPAKKSAPTEKTAKKTTKPAKKRTR